MAKDIKLDNFSVTFHGAELIVDSKVELSCGQKYGLIGVNGSGKSSFLAVLGKCFAVLYYTFLGVVHRIPKHLNSFSL